ERRHPCRHQSRLEAGAPVRLYERMPGRQAVRDREDLVQCLLGHLAGNDLVARRQPHELKAQRLPILVAEVGRQMMTGQSLRSETRVKRGTALPKLFLR